ncbi:hypothetical protein [Cyclobacterium roseum]|uniref:hypothetical protein n=1 Tax=Cyclobacterium roseum TaxID=2666137 RepID=UPI00139078C7|nr:hypothetical protein [Cyclobacterium roseum]
MFFLLLPGIISGQQFYRLKADFSIKEKLADGSSQLIMGKVYYDKVSEKIVYDITFPEPEIWVLKDTSFFRMKERQLLDRKRSFLIPESSFFHFTLTGQLSDFGLKDSPYKIEQVEKDGEMVISTWEPDDTKLKEAMGKVIISNIDKKLNGIVFYNTEGKMLSKQFYQDYINVSGCEFPTEIIQITYQETGQNYQVTTYKNVVINQNGKEDLYNISIPN